MFKTDLRVSKPPRLPFALLPTVLSDVRHMGLLLSGARGVLEAVMGKSGSPKREHLESDTVCLFQT